MSRALQAAPRVLPVLDTVEDVRSWSRVQRRRGHRVALVPTMGALHAGHRALMSAALRQADRVVVSIFVNPAQFRPAEDYARYPRQLDSDLLACREEGVHAVFAPGEHDFYAPDHSIWVVEDALAAPLEGAARPGYFRGVLTVVLKLLAAAEPDVAVFGQKDAQQAILIRRLVRDLNLPVTVAIEPTVREPDGLALSSRNGYLSVDDRSRALVLSRALAACLRRLEQGVLSPGEVRQAGHAVLATQPDVVVDYFEVVDLERLRAPERIDRPVLVAGAIRVGTTRLIDNVVWPPAALCGERRSP